MDDRRASLLKSPMLATLPASSGMLTTEHGAIVAEHAAIWPVPSQSTSVPLSLRQRMSSRSSPLKVANAVRSRELVGDVDGSSWCNCRAKPASAAFERVAHGQAMWLRAIRCRRGPSPLTSPTAATVPVGRGRSRPQLPSLSAGKPPVGCRPASRDRPAVAASRHRMSSRPSPLKSPTGLQHPRSVGARAGGIDVIVPRSPPAAVPSQLLRLPGVARHRASSRPSRVEVADAVDLPSWSSATSRRH